MMNLSVSSAFSFSFRSPKSNVYLSHLHQTEAIYLLLSLSVFFPLAVLPASVFGFCSWSGYCVENHHVDISLLLSLLMMLPRSLLLPLLSLIYAIYSMRPVLLLLIPV